MKNHLNLMRLAILALFISFGADVFAQSNLSAQLHTRAEYRHGCQTLPEADTNPAFFISQDTRLNFDCTAKKFIIGVCIQDVRTRGDVPQEIVYDDARIFGNVDRAQQGLGHALLQSINFEII